MLPHSSENPTLSPLRTDRSVSDRSTSPWRSVIGLSARGIVALVALCAAPGAALAAGADSDAQQLADAAIFTDYLQLDFSAGEKKLKRALSLCKKRGCSDTVHAQVHRDLAVIYVTGMKRISEGEELLVEALTLDPAIALDADLTTPDLLEAFESAKNTLRKREARSAGKEREAEPEPAPPPDKEIADPQEEEAEAPPIGSEDCPPDFPGCEAIGESGVDESESTDSDEPSSHWLSVALQQDFLRFSGESGVCLQNAPDEYSCYRAGDAYRDPTTVGTLGSGGEVTGGFQLATTRLLLGYERDMLLPNLRLGAWLGYAIGGGPAEPGGTGFVPFHAEIRGKYRFPLGGIPVVPFATLGLGLAQVDSSVTTQVVDQELSTGRVARSRVSVWRKTGTTFLGLGGGALYPLGEEAAITAQLQWTALFPSPGGALSLTAAYTHGF